MKPYRGNIQHPATATEYTSNQTDNTRVHERRTSMRRNRLMFPVDTRQNFDRHQSYADIQSEARIKTTRHGRVIKKQFVSETITNQMICEDCGQKFTTLSNLYQHQREQHGEDVKTYRCSFCQKLFLRKFNLTRHLRLVHQ